MITQPSTTYTAEIEAWRASMEQSLRREDGWLALAGLFWLYKGRNTVGSDPANDILLPASAPAHLGVIDFDGTTATLKTVAVEPVSINEMPVIDSVLHDDQADEGPSVVQVGAVSFFVIRRGDQYGVRVRDRNSEARQTFTGRVWFPIDPALRIAATFHPYVSPRMYGVMNVVNIVEQMESPGEITFEIAGQSLRMVAFKEGSDQLWFIFRDATNGDSTYGAGRFLKTPLPVDGVVDLDFNRAYNPPCAFTPYATCPLPPKENVLPVAINAGERG